MRLFDTPFFQAAIVLILSVSVMSAMIWLLFVLHLGSGPEPVVWLTESERVQTEQISLRISEILSRPQPDVIDPLGTGKALSAKNTAEYKAALIDQASLMKRIELRREMDQRMADVNKSGDKADKYFFGGLLVVSILGAIWAVIKIIFLIVSGSRHKRIDALPSRR